MGYKLRKPAVILIAAAILGIGTIGVQASPPCQRFVRKYVEKVANHPVSQATLARWAAWGKAHPNYHPPKHQARLTPKETFDKLNFACEVPLLPLESFALAPSPMSDLVAPVEIARLDAPVPVVPPAFTLVGAPLQVPPTPEIATVSEPGTALYLATGIGLLVLLRKPLSRARSGGSILEASFLAS